MTGTSNPHTPQGCHLRAAENVIDKLALMGWTNIVDGLSLLLPPLSPSNSSIASDHKEGSVAALVSWLLPRALGSGLDTKGTDRSVDPLVTAAARLGITGLDPMQLQRGHGPVRGVGVRTTHS